MQKGENKTKAPARGLNKKLEGMKTRICEPEDRAVDENSRDYTMKRKREHEQSLGVLWDHDIYATNMDGG